VLRPYNKLSDSQQRELQSFLKVNPALVKGHHLKESFQRLVTQRDVDALDGWIHEAAESGLKPFESFARGFVQDYEAIRRALIMPWSTAQCEGQICRVKLIKRQRYGRAKLDLLRQRVLHRSITA
jgi:transposase